MKAPGLTAKDSSYQHIQELKEKECKTNSEKLEEEVLNELFKNLNKNVRNICRAGEIGQHREKKAIPVKDFVKHYLKWSIDETIVSSRRFTCLIDTDGTRKNSSNGKKPIPPIYRCLLNYGMPSKSGDEMGAYDIELAFNYTPGKGIVDWSSAWCASTP